jgi:hypothetical protein
MFIFANSAIEDRSQEEEEEIDNLVSDLKALALTLLWCIFGYSEY